jgi:hypothetical protein
MAATDPADDPIRAEVERWLRAVVGATIALPAAVVLGAGRCAARRARAAGARLTQPARLAASLLTAAGRARPRTATEPRPEPPTTTARPPVVVPAPEERPSVDATALPIDQYESLAASQVVARLPSLTAGELDVVRRFEAANRARRTVLGKIDQLLAPA